MADKSIEIHLKSHFATHPENDFNLEQTNSKLNIFLLKPMESRLNEWNQPKHKVAYYQIPESTPS